MADTALRLDHVHKKFRRGEMYNSLRDLIPAMTGRFLRRFGSEKLERQEFWALKDVTFQVAKGEAVGIIGSNGAGKSTMLKLLSGIMKPTSGAITVNGKLSALIEVGAGFHPDLTGRENIFLNGVILGMTRNDIKRKFDQIVEFSGLAEFIDTPVKRYSSGMFARLGFSVAAHVDPDILIVDEVLSVGDYVFQKKCIERMNEVLHDGTTVIFVSHNLRAVTDLCHRCVLLDHGSVLSIGPTADIVRNYMSLVSENRGDQSDKPVRITRLDIRSEAGPSVTFSAGQRAWVDIELTATRPVEKIAVVLELQDNSFYEIFNTSSERLGIPPLSLKAGETFTCTFALQLHLSAGTFHLGAALYRYDIQKAFDSWSSSTTIFVKSPIDVRGAANLYPTVTMNRKSEVK